MAVDDDHEPDDIIGEAPEDFVIAPADALRMLRAKQAERSALIERFGGTGAPERDIAIELATAVPLAHPALFEQAHRNALASIEVLERNGARGAKLPRLGPLKPVASVMVRAVTRWIVRHHLNTLTRRICAMCARREAITVPGSAELVMLRRARLRTRLVEEGYGDGGNSAGLPAFLVGGALLSTVASTAQNAIETVFHTTHGEVVLAGVALAILGSISWVALFAAGVARRRIRMTTDVPVGELWLALGNCGRPPRDRSLGFAIYAIAISVVAWVAVPLVFYLIVDAVRR